MGKQWAKWGYTTLKNIRKKLDTKPEVVGVVCDTQAASEARMEYNSYDHRLS